MFLKVVSSKNQIYFHMVEDKLVDRKVLLADTLMALLDSGDKILTIEPAPDMTEEKYNSLELRKL